MSSSTPDLFTQPPLKYLLWFHFLIPPTYRKWFEWHPTLLSKLQYNPAFWWVWIWSKYATSWSPLKRSGFCAQSKSSPAGLDDTKLMLISTLLFKCVGIVFAYMLCARLDASSLFKASLGSSDWAWGGLWWLLNPDILLPRSMGVQAFHLEK